MDASNSPAIPSYPLSSQCWAMETRSITNNLFTTGYISRPSSARYLSTHQRSAWMDDTRTYFVCNREVGTTLDDLHGLLATAATTLPLRAKRIPLESTASVSAWRPSSWHRLVRGENRKQRRNICKEHLNAGRDLQ